MCIEPPLELLRNGHLFGKIVTYGYETPWATGTIEAVNPSHLQQMIALCQFLETVESWPELDSDEAEESRWQLALEQRGLSQEDYDHYSQATWLVQTQDGTQHAIFAPHFDPAGFVTWRW